MNFPVFGRKHAHDPAFTAAQFVEELIDIGTYPAELGLRGVYVTYQDPFLDEMALGEVLLEERRFTLYGLQHDDRVGVVSLPPGAPITAIVTSILYEYGVETVVIFEYCGCLQADVRGGDLVVVESAIRDEGTSYHYLPPSRTVAASSSLTRRIESVLDAEGYTRHTGTSWSTDAYFRETSEEIARYAAEGVLGVEMNAAALFAVARYLGIDAGAVLLPTDYLVDAGWEFERDRPVDQIAGLEAALTPLLATGPARMPDGPDAEPP